MIVSFMASNTGADTTSNTANGSALVTLQSAVTSFIATQMSTNMPIENSLGTAQAGANVSAKSTDGSLQVTLQSAGHTLQTTVLTANMSVLNSLQTSQVGAQTSTISVGGSVKVTLQSTSQTFVTACLTRNGPISANRGEAGSNTTIGTVLGTVGVVGKSADVVANVVKDVSNRAKDKSGTYLLLCAPCDEAGATTGCGTVAGTDCSWNMANWSSGQSVDGSMPDGHMPGTFIFATSSLVNVRQTANGTQLNQQGT